MVGHDLHSNTDQVNICTSNKNYANENNKPIPHVNWVTQWETLRKNFLKLNL